MERESAELLVQQLLDLGGHFATFIYLAPATIAVANLAIGVELGCPII